jgi:hypothetical protein
MNEWKKKYLAVLEELVRVKSQCERQEEVIQELRILCNAQQDELRALKYKHP